MWNTIAALRFFTVVCFVVVLTIRGAIAYDYSLIAETNTVVDEMKFEFVETSKPETCAYQKNKSFFTYSSPEGVPVYDIQKNEAGIKQEVQTWRIRTTKDACQPSVVLKKEVDDRQVSLASFSITKEETVNEWTIKFTLKYAASKGEVSTSQNDKVSTPQPSNERVYIAFVFPAARCLEAYLQVDIQRSQTQECTKADHLRLLSPERKAIVPRGEGGTPHTPRTPTLRVGAAYPANDYELAVTLAVLVIFFTRLEMLQGLFEYCLNGNKACLTLRLFVHPWK
jgi:hypothetical protein